VYTRAEKGENCKGEKRIMLCHREKLEYIYGNGKMGVLKRCVVMRRDLIFKDMLLLIQEAVTCF
jgi:hypothetical protein